MAWERRMPDGVGDVNHTGTGFTASVSIPIGDDGYFGRECPGCRAPFKMLFDEYEQLPDDIQLTCPYCGHREDHGEFMTASQRDRVMAAASQVAKQYIHEELNKAFGKTFRRSRRSGSAAGVEIKYTPGRPPPIRALPDIVEEPTRRVIPCSMCRSHFAVYSASSFCPVCGPRPAGEKVLEAIAAAREALILEDRLDEEDREVLRASGVLERFAVDANESVVSLFEMFARDQFSQRVADADQYTKGKGNVFQRLEETAVLFRSHADIDIRAIAGDDRWRRLQRVFAFRHAHAHNDGIVDAKVLVRLPDLELKAGQRIVISRREAESALDDLAFVVRAVSEA